MSCVCGLYAVYLRVSYALPRFAKIVYINQQTKAFHLQWFEHASRTILQEISDPQELFLTELCDTMGIELIVDKVDVHWGPPPALGLSPLSFFCKSVIPYPCLCAALSCVAQHDVHRTRCIFHQD